MNADFLISVLNDVDTAARINREKASNIVLQNPKLVKNLVEFTFDVDNKLSIKAAWILEWICTHHGYYDVVCSNSYGANGDEFIRN